jgi:DNA-binding NtrC family response regulator
VIELEIPPLAQRRDDILVLARHFLQPGFILTADVERALIHYPWPGNVRELQNVMRRACLLAREPKIGVGDLNLPVVSQPALDEAALDRVTIEQALARAQGVVAQAARELGLSRQALYRRMEKLGLKS